MDALLHVFRALESPPLRDSSKRPDDPQQLCRTAPQEGSLTDQGTALVGDSSEDK
jgi:hypothetical protein